MPSRRVSIDFTWYHYFDLAQQLFNDSNNNLDLSEALLRSAISRAYFAIHCLARNYLIKERNLTPPNKKKDMHSWVIKQIKNEPETRKVHVQLRRLRDDRNRADYEDVVRRLKTVANGALIGARKAIEILDEL